jgi:hypothetical protein
MILFLLLYTALQEQGSFFIPFYGPPGTGFISFLYTALKEQDFHLFPFQEQDLFFILLRSRPGTVFYLLFLYTAL